MGLLGHTFVNNNAKEMEQMLGIKWTYLHVLMHVHILTKVWDQKRDDWNMYTG